MLLHLGHTYKCMKSNVPAMPIHLNKINGGSDYIKDTCTGLK